MSVDRGVGDLGERLEAHLIDGAAGEGLDPALIRAARGLKAEWQAEMESIHVPMNIIPTKNKSYVNKSFHYIGIAAAIIIAVIGIKYTMSNSPQTKAYSTTPGQRTTITLADGSQAILAPATTIHVTGRNVNLDGEALFTVTTHANSPFTVTTGKSVTKVLGTTFSVRSYKDEPNIHVAVAEGRVMVNNSVLANGDLASVNTNGVVDVVHDAERVADMLAFAHGRLVIAVQPLAHAAPEIARWYGLDITVDSSAANQHIGITLQGQSANEALAMIAELTHTRYRIKGKSVTFTR